MSHGFKCIRLYLWEPCSHRCWSRLDTSNILAYHQGMTCLQQRGYIPSRLRNRKMVKAAGCFVSNSSTVMFLGWPFQGRLYRLILNNSKKTQPWSFTWITLILQMYDYTRKLRQVHIILNVFCMKLICLLILFSKIDFCFIHFGTMWVQGIMMSSTFSRWIDDGSI